MRARDLVPVIVLVIMLVGAVMVADRISGSALAGEAKKDPAPKTGKVRTLLVTGGPIHNGKEIGDIVQEALNATGMFDVTRVHEDFDAFLPDRIAPFEVVLFYNTLGELNEARKRGLMNHIAAGKGFVTWHSGADSFREDPDYRVFVGGYFIGHPAYRTYQVSVTENDSPITRGIEEFMITDEQYILDYDPRVNVLANALHKGKTMPVLWTKPWGKGRIFYSALGHDPKACQQEMFLKTLIRGTLWAADRPVTD